VKVENTVTPGDNASEIAQREIDGSAGHNDVLNARNAWTHNKRSFRQREFPVESLS